MTDQAATGQVNTNAAEVYDAFFVPALFGAWAGPLCDAATLAPGVTVLDVACGTGATTREAAARVAPSGSATGLDLNPGMLAVAGTRAPEIDWVEGAAERLPFADDSFDAVLCQFGCMFFQDRGKALSEMARAVRRSGRVAVSVWDRVENSPGYARMIALIDRLFGRAPADALRAPFVLGDRQEFGAALAAGGLESATVGTLTGTARFESIAEWVRMDVRGWTLADMIDDDQFARLVAAADQEFGDLVGHDGTVAFPAPAHIAVWEKP